MVELEDRGNPALDPPAEMPVGRPVGENRAMYLSRRDFNRYGYSDWCVCCKAIASGRKYPKGRMPAHNAACRRIMEAAVQAEASAEAALASEAAAQEEERRTWLAEMEQYIANYLDAHAAAAAGTVAGG